MTCLLTRRGGYAPVISGTSVVVVDAVTGKAVWSGFHSEAGH